LQGVFDDGISFHGFIVDFCIEDGLSRFDLNGGWWCDVGE
jgi:hypothetical protein